MILEKRNDLSAFREAVRTWLSDVVPENWQRKLAGATHKEFYEFQQWWMAERRKVDLATPHWPAEYGGAGLSLTHQIIISEEIARANAPSTEMFVVALNHIPATLIAWGTEVQKDKYLPGVSRGQVWCQGFSEPNAGSDLASLRTKAVLDGDHYVVNGQKIWSSYSMYADYCILLARTDFEARKHSGITYFILDMHAEGVEVRPIRQATGRSEFAEIFLTDARIPVEDRIGAESEGWKVAQTTLASERGILAFEGMERLRYTLERVLSTAIAENAPWLADDQNRRDFMILFADLLANRRLIRRLLHENEFGDGAPSVVPSVIKLFGSTWRQRFGDFLTKVGGLTGQQFVSSGDDTDAVGMYNFLSSFGDTISGGTNEIMRNLIAERGLGLPR